MINSPAINNNEFIARLLFHKENVRNVYNVLRINETKCKMDWQLYTKRKTYLSH